MFSFFGMLSVILHIAHLFCIFFAYFFVFLWHIVHFFVFFLHIVHIFRVICIHCKFCLWHSSTTGAGLRHCSCLFVYWFRNSPWTIEQSPAAAQDSAQSTPKRYSLHTKLKMHRVLNVLILLRMHKMLKCKVSTNKASSSGLCTSCALAQCETSLLASCGIVTQLKPALIVLVHIKLRVHDARILPRSQAACADGHTPSPSPRHIDPCVGLGAALGKKTARRTRTQRSGPLCSSEAQRLVLLHPVLGAAWVDCGRWAMPSESRPRRPDLWYSQGSATAAAGSQPVGCPWACCARREEEA